MRSAPFDPLASKVFLSLRDDRGVFSSVPLTHPSTLDFISSSELYD